MGCERTLTLSDYKSTTPKEKSTIPCRNLIHYSVQRFSLWCAELRSSERREQFFAPLTRHFRYDIGRMAHGRIRCDLVGSVAALAAQRHRAVLIRHLSYTSLGYASSARPAVLDTG